MDKLINEFFKKKRVFTSLDDKKRTLLLNALSAAKTSLSTSSTTSSGPATATTVVPPTPVKSNSSGPTTGSSMGLPSRPKFDALRSNSSSSSSSDAGGIVFFGGGGGSSSSSAAPATPAQRTLTMPSMIPSTPSRSTTGTSVVAGGSLSSVSASVEFVPSTPSTAQKQMPKRLGAAMRTVKPSSSSSSSSSLSSAATAPSGPVAPASSSFRKVNPSFLAASRDVIAITIAGPATSLPDAKADDMQTEEVKAEESMVATTPPPVIDSDKENVTSAEAAVKLTETEEQPAQLFDDAVIVVALPVDEPVATESQPQPDSTALPQATPPSTDFKVADMITVRIAFFFFKKNKK